MTDRESAIATLNNLAIAIKNHPTTSLSIIVRDLITAMQMLVDPTILKEEEDYGKEQHAHYHIPEGYALHKVGDVMQIKPYLGEGADTILVRE